MGSIVSTVVIAAVLAIALFFAARSVYRNSKSGGCSGCSGGCGGCSGCHSTPKK